MKKIVGIVLALALVFSLSVTAFAANTQVDQNYDGPNPTTTVEFIVTPAYTITIPGEVTLTGKEGTYKGEAKITATAGVLLPEGKVIKVTLDSDLTLDTGLATPATKLHYTIKVNQNTDPIDRGAVVAIFETNSTDEQNSILHFEADNPTYAGNYTDTVTFTISVKNK